MGDVAAAELVEHLKPPELKIFAKKLDTSDHVKLIVLSNESADDLLNGMSQQRRERIETTLSYPEESAGRLMQSNAIDVRPDVSIETALPETAW